MESAARQAFSAAGLTPEKESTEWDDQLRKHGIIAALPPKTPTAELPTYSVDNRDPSETFDEELIDEQEYSKFRAQRLAEMKAEAVKKHARIEDVRLITKSQWQKEVTDAGETYVLIHMFQQGNKLCDKLHEHHSAVARRHPAIKCLRIVATDAVPNYPAKNIPTLLLYHRSDPVDQLVGPSALAHVNADMIEKFLIRKHALEGSVAKKKVESDEEGSD